MYSINQQSSADIAQLVELLICNQWVRGSSPCVGTITKNLEIKSSLELAFVCLLYIFGALVFPGVVGLLVLILTAF